MTEMTTGAPMNAVTALIGRLPSKPGMRAMRLQKSAISIPMSMVAGMSRRWSLLLNKNRAICGIARPTKAIGPQ